MICPELLSLSALVVSEKAQNIAAEEGRALWDVVSNAEKYPELQKASAKLKAFTEMMEILRSKVGAECMVIITIQASLGS